jgi:hypothetical protein
MWLPGRFIGRCRGIYRGCDRAGAERARSDASVLEIEFGRDIRVRIAATAPTGLATAVIKALAGR